VFVQVSEPISSGFVKTLARNAPIRTPIRFGFSRCCAWAARQQPNRQYPGSSRTGNTYE